MPMTIEQLTAIVEKCARLYWENHFRVLIKQRGTFGDLMSIVLADVAPEWRNVVSTLIYCDKD